MYLSGEVTSIPTQTAAWGTTSGFVI